MSKVILIFLLFVSLVVLIISFVLIALEFRNALLTGSRIDTSLQLALAFPLLAVSVLVGVVSRLQILRQNHQLWKSYLSNFSPKYDTFNFVDLQNPKIKPPDEIKLFLKQLTISKAYMPRVLEVEIDASAPTETLVTTVIVQEPDDVERLTDKEKPYSVTGTPSSTLVKRLTKEKITLHELLEVRKAKKLIVVGDAGSGKSTLLRWLSLGLSLEQLNTLGDFPHKEALPKHLVPIFFECRGSDKVVDAITELEHLIEHSPVFRETKGQTKNKEGLSTALLKHANNSTAILMIDGLDEISDIKKRQAFASAIASISKKYANLAIIISSRAARFDEIAKPLRASDFKEVRFGDVEFATKEVFLGFCCSHLFEASNRDTELTKLKTYVDKDTEANKNDPLTNSPLALTILAILKQKNPHLPSNLDDLYGQIIQEIISWSPDRFMGIYSKHVQVIVGSIFEYIGYEMKKLDTLMVSRNKMKNFVKAWQELQETNPPEGETSDEHNQIIEQYKTDTPLESVLESVLETGSIIITYNIDNYEFEHPIFRDHFALAFAKKNPGSAYQFNGNDIIKSQRSGEYQLSSANNDFVDKMAAYDAERTMRELLK